MACLPSKKCKIAKFKINKID